MLVDPVTVAANGPFHSTRIGPELLLCGPAELGAEPAPAPIRQLVLEVPAGGGSVAVLSRFNPSVEPASTCPPGGSSACRTCGPSCRCAAGGDAVVDVPSPAPYPGLCQRRGARGVTTGVSMLLLRVHDLGHDCRVLGPGRQAVVWLQVCTIGCRGCESPRTLDPAGGRLVLVDELDAEGLTLSGGEPFQ